MKDAPGAYCRIERTGIVVAREPATGYPAVLGDLVVIPTFPLDWLQFSMVAFVPDDRPASACLILSADRPVLPGALASFTGVLRDTFRAAGIGVISSYGEGDITAEVLTPIDAFCLAATIATVAAVNAWDESDPIVVTLDSHRIPVRMTYEAGRWRATQEDGKPRKSGGDVD